jgi:gas vesicle protein
MEHTPYYRSPTSIVSILAGAAAGVAAATLFDPPSGGVTPVKVRPKVLTIDDDAALANGGKRSYS